MNRRQILALTADRIATKPEEIVRPSGTEREYASHIEEVVSSLSKSMSEADAARIADLIYTCHQIGFLRGRREPIV